MPNPWRVIAMQQGLMVPACKPWRIPLLSMSSLSTSYSNRPINPAHGLGRLLLSDRRCLASPIFSSRLLRHWKIPALLKGLCLVFSRNLAGRAHIRAVTVSARLSTSFSTEEAQLVEGSLKEVQTTLDGNSVVEDTKLEGNMKRLAGSNIVMDMNMGRRHLIKQVEFVKSSPKESECPKDGLPEFALVGRSNVGKSSLVNALVNRKEIAQTSKRPGKTQLINHFRVNNSWYLVDLPGYGYAKAPMAVKTEWNEFTKTYFLNRKSLVAVMLLVDGSIPPLQIDLDCANWLGRNKIPVTIVFTKCDRRKKKKNGGKPPDENVREFEKQLQESYDQTPAWIMTSSTTGQGKEELLKHMAKLLEYWDN